MLFQLLTLTASAYQSRYEMSSMSDLEFYTLFAKSIAEHDSYILSVMIPNSGGEKQFDHLQDVKFASYSVETDGKGSPVSRGGAKITFDIKESKDELFPQGVHEYYALYSVGMTDNFTFCPYEERNVTIAEKYRMLANTFSDISCMVSGYEELTEYQLANIDYSYSLVHTVYHDMFQTDDNGIEVSTLNKKLKTLFCSKKSLSNQTVEELKSHFYEKNKCFYHCNHDGLSMTVYEIKSVTRNKKTKLYTMEIWYYSDAAKLNACRKIRYTYSEGNSGYTLKKADVTYSSGYEIFNLV